MMGFKKVELLLLLILLQFLLLLHLDAATTTTTTDFVQEPNAIGSKIDGDKEMTAKLTGSKRVVSVDRRGGGVGGHGGGGGHGFGGSRGGRRANGGRGAGESGEVRGSSVNRGPNLIPFYAAGALPHRQNNQNHNGSNHVDPPSLLLVLLLVLYLFNMLHR